MRPTASSALLAVGTGLLTAGVALSFWAGCTGDAKGGALGDPVAALQLQSFSALAAFASALAFIGAAATVTRAGSNTKVKLALAAALATAVIWFTVGWQAEVQGVKQCLTQP